VNSKVATKQTLKLRTFNHPVRFAAGLVMLLLGVISCGGGKQANVPADLIRNYIAKHTPMVDTSLADLYVEEERNDVLQQIENTIADSKEKGTYEKLSEANFDFSGLSIKVLESTDTYINDEITDFLKVATKGSVTMSFASTSKKIPADSVLILEKEGSDWKITEKTNPWS
jgi:hypothetical protein